MTDNLNQESLYFSLFTKAVDITTRSMSYLPTMRVRETAHDITVDFLFFSHSYRETYDASKGKVMPFFSSYVRKKLRRMWEVYNDELVMGSLHEGQIAGASVLPGVDTWVELKLCVKKLHDMVKGQKCSGVPVDAVLRAGLLLHANEGKLSVKSVCDELGTTNRKGVRDSLKLIQRLLICNLGVCDEPYFYTKRYIKRVTGKGNGSGKGNGGGEEVQVLL